MQIGCKIWPIKNLKYEGECKWKNDKCVWGALDDTVAPKGELQYLHIIYIYKDAQEGSPDVALKGTLLVALELHLFMQLLKHKSVQSDSTF